MYIYILFYLIILIPVILSKGKIASSNKWIFYFALPIFLCFGYMVGSDWRSYELTYYTFELTDIAYSRKELGYYVLGYYFRKLGFEFWHYAILIKLIGYYLFIHFFKKFSENNFHGFVMFFSNTAMFLWIDHPARNFVAVIIYLFAIKYMHERKLIKYIAITLVASLFHITVLFLIPIYFLYRKYNTKMLVIISISAFAILVFQQLFLDSITSFLSYSVMFESRMESYIDSDYMTRSGSYVGLVIITLLISIMLLNREEIENRFKYGKVLIFLSVVYLVFTIIGLAFPIFFRFKFFFAMPYFVMLSTLFNTSENIKKIIVSFIILVLPLAILIRDINNTYQYIPYTNYLEYIYKPKPSYHYRSNHNLINGPQKK